MDARPQDLIDRWLKAEQDDLEREAEAALAELMGELPRPAPPAGFAGRVMLALPAPAPPAAAAVPAMVPAMGPSRGLWASLWLRGVLAFTLAAAALVAAVAPGAFAALLRLVSPGRVLSLSIHFLSETAEALASALAFLLRFEALGRAAAVLLTAPQVTGSLAGCMLVSAVAFYLLHDVLTKRSWSHAHTH